MYPGKRKLLALLIAALVLLAMGGWVAALWWFGRILHPLAPVAGGVAVAGGALAGAYLLYRLVVPTPALVIGPQGVMENASMLGAGLIRWDEIDAIVTYDFRGQRFLGILPIDVNALLRRQARWKSRLMQMNMRLGAAPVNVPQSVLPMTADELATQIANGYGVRIEKDFRVVPHPGPR